LSSAELVMGVPLTLPSQLSSDKEVPQQQVLKALRSLKPPALRPLTYAQAAASLPANLFTADFVYIRRGGVAPPLAPVYMGPYKVLDRSEKVFQVLIGGRSEAVSVDRVKPHLGTSPVSPATPPLRGRPPRPAPAVPVSASSSSSAASTGGGGAPVAAWKGRPAAGEIREAVPGNPGEDCEFLASLFCTLV
jgi:hypothetical protein